uniref:ATP synthase subunit 8 n=1 Tax=Lyonsia norwegica TaxID=228471 RepID=A0A1U9XPH5_LYONO|nr:ATP synthase F0 subunit 8 [Lyonsia norwegica]AQZ26151.1 ATP synthase subunit 8 [Lyonsia norwegica]
MPQFGPLNWIISYLAVVVGLMAVVSTTWWMGYKTHE